MFRIRIKTANYRILRFVLSLNILLTALLGAGGVVLASDLTTIQILDPRTGTFSWTPSFIQVGSYPNVHFDVSKGI